LRTLSRVFSISSQAAGGREAACLEFAHRQRNTASHPTFKEKQMELIFAIVVPVIMIIAINSLLQYSSQARFAA
jgi:hypothetical protein